MASQVGGTLLVYAIACLNSLIHMQFVYLSWKLCIRYPYRQDTHPPTAVSSPYLSRASELYQHVSSVISSSCTVDSISDLYRDTQH